MQKPLTTCTSSRDAFENNFGVGILRNGNEGFDFSERLLELNVNDLTAFKHGKK